MMRVYLEPLRERRLLPAEPLDRLIDASASVARFQRSFLEELQEAAGYEPNVGLSFAAPSHLRVSVQFYLRSRERLHRICLTECSTPCWWTVSEYGCQVSVV